MNHSTHEKNMKTTKQQAGQQTSQQTDHGMEYTKYEKARMIGSRALQLAMGAPFLLKLSVQDLERIRYNPITIAEIEFAEGVMPITVKRPEMH